MLHMRRLTPIAMAATRIAHIRDLLQFHPQTGSGGKLYNTNKPKVMAGD